MTAPARECQPDTDRDEFMRRIMSNLDDALTQQNIAYHDRIVDLENALRTIAKKRKLDACAAASMQAIARSALPLERSGGAT